MTAGGLQRLELSACEPAALLEALAAWGCNRVLWECGPDLAAAALRQGCVQELTAVIAPKLLGGRTARTPLGELNLTTLQAAPRGEWSAMERYGSDWISQLQLIQIQGQTPSADQADLPSKAIAAENLSSPASSPPPDRG
jgi:diaminohydroxyphosphoribosylaminopyrimidine deaminase/5-amino-6-(5-phosphoribosylamino)uracil reductase